MKAASTATPPGAAPLVPTANLFSLGAELLGEVQHIIGTDKVRSLRIKLGNRVIREVPIAPMTAVATLGLVLLAVIISTISIEVEHEPAGAAPNSEASR